MIFIYAILLLASRSILHAEIQNNSFEFDGRLRNYMVYLPNNYTGGTNFPLVIHLHSGGWTAQQDMNYTKLNQVAENNGFIVVYPSAIDMRWNSGGRPAPDVDDVGFINALIDIMSSRYSIDRERIYACGYSRGGFMAHTLACQLGHRIAAIASVAGVISTSVADSCRPLSTMPVLHIHGTADTWVSINGASGFYSADQTISYWTGFNDCGQVDTAMLPDLDPTDGCTVEKTTYTNCSDNSNVVYYKVIDGGHTWPGAGPPGYAAGRTNQDFDASAEIWNFFKNHKLAIRPLVDFNGDGIVNAADMCIMVDHWGEDYSLCDIGPPPFGDGVIDVEDLKVLAEHLFEEVDDPTLMAHWALDETEGMVVGDSVGEHHAYVLGDAVWQPDGGQVNGALEFDGIDDFISAPAVLNPADGPFSVLIWVKGGGPGQAIISESDGPDWLSLDPQTGHLMTELTENGRSRGPLLSQAVIDDGKWHRIGLVWDGSYRTLCVDGITVAQDTQSNLEGSASGLYIGCGDPTQPETFFSGLIDDVRIYNRAINP